MSLKRMPGWGKSGTSTTSRSRAARAWAARGVTSRSLLAALGLRLPAGLLATGGRTARDRPGGGRYDAPASHRLRSPRGRRDRPRRLGVEVVLEVVLVQLDRVCLGVLDDRHVVLEH